MNWAALIAAALILWGWTPSREIIVTEEPVRDNPYHISRVTYDDDYCYIHVYPWNPAYDPFKIIAHEVGHCIGLNHIDYPSIMNATYEGYEFSGYDRSEFWHHYPAPNQYILTNLGADH